jgi:hypothetical protein
VQYPIWFLIVIHKRRCDEPSSSLTTTIPAKLAFATSDELLGEIKIIVLTKCTLSLPVKKSLDYLLYTAVLCKI